MDFIILKINGHDLSQFSHEQTLEVFRSSQEPIHVEVLRRPETSAILDKNSASVSTSLFDAFPEKDEILPYAVTKVDCRKPAIDNNQLCVTSLSSATSQPPATCLDNVNSRSLFLYHQTKGNPLQRPRARLPFILSDDKDIALTDLEFDLTLQNADQEEEDEDVEAFCNYEDLDKFAFEMEYEEITLARDSAAEKLGLTLCYSPIDQDPDAFVNVFVSDVVTDSVAGRDGRIQKGDQVLRINGENIHSRIQAIHLIQAAVPLATILLAHPNLDMMAEGSPASWPLDELHLEMSAEFSPQSSSRQQLTKVELHSLQCETAVGIREMDSGVSSTQSSEQETADDLAAALYKSISLSQYHQQMQQLFPNKKQPHTEDAQDHERSLHPNSMSETISSDIRAPISSIANVSARPSVPRMGTRLRRVQEDSLNERQVENQTKSENAPLQTEGKHSGSNIAPITLHENPPHPSNWPACLKAAASTSPMEWVLKRRSDGSHYVARRPIRNQFLRDRARRVAEERASMTTDDDVASQLGHWLPRNQRKCQTRRVAPMLNVVVDKTIHEYENNVELSTKALPTAPLSHFSPSSGNKLKKSFSRMTNQPKVLHNCASPSIPEEKASSNNTMTFV